MNTTDEIVNTDIDWASRSPVLNYPSTNLPTIYFSIALGFGMIIHSWYLNRWKWTMVRIWSEIASLSLAGAAICFLQCVDNSCEVLTQAIVYNVIGNCTFGLLAQTADNYLTFQRYQAVVGNATTLHKVCAFLWYFILLDLSWVPFYSIFPIWFDQNSELWIWIGSVCGGYINFSAYILFNLYHEILVMQEIIRFRQSTRASITADGREDYLLEIGIRAILHSTCSIVGIFLYSFHLPDGVLEQIIMEAGSIHFFLNWKTIKFTAVIKKVYKCVSGSRLDARLNVRVGVAPSGSISTNKPSEAIFVPQY